MKVIVTKKRPKVRTGHPRDDRDAYRNETMAEE
jgi:hypothetical protein